MTSVVPCLLSAPWASLPCSHFSIFLLSLLLFLLSLTSSLLLAPHALGVSLLGAAALGGPSPATSFGRIVLLVFRLQGGVCGIGLGLVVLACLIVLAGSGCPSFATPAGLAVVVLSSQTLHDRDILVLTVVHLGTPFAASRGARVGVAAGVADRLHADQLGLLPGRGQRLVDCPEHVGRFGH